MQAPTRRNPLVVAFGIAVLSDVMSMALALAPPIQWVLDLGTALALFVVLGRRKILLAGLIMEAIPGLYIFPFWVLVVGAIAKWGNVRPGKPSRP